MSNEEAREEIRAAINFYDEHGWCWVSAVTFIGIRAMFGGWYELVKSLQPQYRSRIIALSSDPIKAPNAITPGQ